MSVELSMRINAGILTRTPVILQTESAECGLACIAMVAGHYGHRMDLPAARRRFSTSMKGMTLRDLTRIGSEMNLATRALRLELADLAKLRLPCILHWEHNHFVVLVHVGNRSITIHDPSLGKRRVPMYEVSRKFTGVALEASPTDTFEKKNEILAIRITDLIRGTHGVGGVALQVLAISLLLELAIIAMPIGFQLILDEVVVAADSDLLTLIILGMSMLLLFQVVAGFARTFITMRLGSSLALQWKAGLFDHLLRLPLQFFERRHVGDVVSRFGSIDEVQRTLTSDAIRAFLDGIMSIALLLMMWLFGGSLVLIPLASAILYAVMRCVTYSGFRDLSEEAIIQRAKENSHFMESVRGIGSLKVLNLEKRRREGWVNHLVERVNAELRVQKFNAIFQASATTVFGVDRLLILYFSVTMVIAGDMSVGMIVAFLAYKDQFTARINGLVDVSLQFRMLSLHGERIGDIALSDPEEERTRPFALPVAAGAGPIQPAELAVRDLHFRYADNQPEILDGVSFVIRPGECVGIAGASGAGKSTLLKILAGLTLPGTGQVLINSRPVATLGLAVYRDRIGCVLQDDRLFAGSILENITSFDPDPDPSRMATCASMAAIHEEIIAMPMGYETLVGDMGSAMSGGQKQRIVLARALYRRPSILFLDEATSHLDTGNEQVINTAIRALPMTRVIIAHRAATLAATDRVLVLADGRISEQSALARA